jgi:hypothetical protein
MQGRVSRPGKDYRWPTSSLSFSSRRYLPPGPRQRRDSLAQPVRAQDVRAGSEIWRSPEQRPRASFDLGEHPSGTFHRGIRDESRGEIFLQGQSEEGPPSERTAFLEASSQAPSPAQAGFGATRVDPSHHVRQSFSSARHVLPIPAGSILAQSYGSQWLRPIGRMKRAFVTTAAPNQVVRPRRVCVLLGRDSPAEPFLLPEPEGRRSGPHARTFGVLPRDRSKAEPTANLNETVCATAARKIA